MTWQPNDTIISDALAYAATVQPLEACGVVQGSTFLPVTNRATQWDAFVMDMREYLAIAKRSRIEAIVHSHVYAPPIPSEGDLAACEDTGLPWLIIGWPVGKWKVIEPTGWRAPLVGRKWAHGTHDCFGTIRDGIRLYAGVELPNFPREWEWWETGGNIIADQFAEAGFVEVGGAWQHCDLALMQVPPSRVINHLALFVAPDMILHQLLGRNSVREIYGGVWQKLTRLHLRHRDLIDKPPPAPADPYSWSDPA
jgi:proteasome lid subunit RPN8/RPN11